ncbi:cytosolic 5'-nucleotidase 3-like isoform X2 [Gigantopelta aegis]|uniref:cytosolic 5'-nucleotidase 3-like isoform X2 n=1 Tax=Gigantopelta aegis TaxID=1735272 RepID=UPI001B88BD63|nr:cytosolic 5'-nucleotidase 3-like isoform X2 [Gigantopelta aegis]
MDLVPELKQPHVHIKNVDHVTKTLCQMISHGSKKLQVVADFDRTLSKYSHRGQVCATCHNVLEESRIMPDVYKKKTTELRDYYMPIEFDASLTKEQKIPHIIEWYTRAHDVLLACHMTKDDIIHMVRESKLQLRDGCQWFFSELHKLGVPLLIFSAGIGDVIEEVIRQQSKMYPNMQIVSNFMDFDSEGKLIGFKGTLIHSFNKNEDSIHASDYFEKLKNHENLLLIGDHVGDVLMADGAEITSSLKIGFLNHNVEKNLESYKESFDIVIQEDETMDIVNAIIRKISEV